MRLTQVIDPILETSKSYVKRAVKPGDIVIDATFGNGLDTEFLSALVGENGHVYGFDIQEEAKSVTEYRLTESGCPKNVTLFLQSHESMSAFLPAGIKGHVSAVMYNLGYLPHGDKTITTDAVTTLHSIEDAIQLLSLHGIITVVAYPGHEAGQLERDAVLAWMNQLDHQEFKAIRYQMINVRNNPPELFVIEKVHE